LRSYRGVMLGGFTERLRAQLRRALLRLEVHIRDPEAVGLARSYALRCSRSFLFNGMPPRGVRCCHIMQLLKYVSADPIVDVVVRICTPAAETLPHCRSSP
jgi:hypothetical protein